MSPESPISPTIIFGPAGKQESNKSSISLDTGLVDFPENRTQVDPLAREGITRILLGPTASKHLTESGAECFAIVGKVPWPGDASRWAIYLLPVPLAGANAATSVLLGTHRAAPIRRPSPQPTPDTATPVSYTHLTLPTIYSV